MTYREPSGQWTKSRYSVQDGLGLGSRYIVIAMQPHEKLAKLLAPLEAGGAGVSPHWLGEKIQSQGLKSGYNLVYKWSRGVRGFGDRSQRLVEEVMGKPRGWFSNGRDIDEEIPTPGSSTPESVLSFLESDFAAKLDPPTTQEELRMLRAHHVEGHVSDEYYYYFLLAERARLKVPTMRPNDAAGAAAKGGLRKRIPTPAKKGRRKNPA